MWVWIGKKCYQEDRKTQFYHIFTKQCVIRVLINKYAGICVSNISTWPNLVLLRIQLEIYCIYLCKCFVLTCLRLAYVHVEKCSTHVPVRIWIKIVLCQTVQLQFTIITRTVWQQLHSFFPNEVSNYCFLFLPVFGTPSKSCLLLLPSQLVPVSFLQ